MDKDRLTDLRDVLLKQPRIETDGSWREVIDNAGIGISAVAKDGTYLYVNKVYSEELGYTDKKEIAPGVFVPELFFTKVGQVTIDIPKHHVIKAIEAGFKFGTTRKGQGDYNAFRKQWRHKQGHTVTGICRSNVYDLGGMPAMFSWISFKKRNNYYENLADVKRHSIEELEHKISAAYNRIDELKIEIKERRLEDNYGDSDDCKTCGKPK